MEAYLIIDLGNNTVVRQHAYDDDDIVMADNGDTILIDIFEMEVRDNGTWVPIDLVEK